MEWEFTCVLVMLVLFVVLKDKRKKATHELKFLQDISRAILNRYYDGINHGEIELYDRELDTFITKRESQQVPLRYIKIEETKGYTRCTNKSTISMRILDDAGSPFDKGTLLLVLLHELTHFLCSSIITDHEDKEFRYIESKLYWIIRQLDSKAIDLNGGIDDRYPMKP